MILPAVFLIREILVRIRIRILRSVHLISNPDPDPALFVSDFQDASKKYFFFPFCFAYYGTFFRYPTFISVFEDKKS